MTKTNIEYKDKSITCSRSFDNEYQMRNWVKRFNKTAHKTAERLTYLIGTGNLLSLPGIFTSALRG